MEPDSHGLTFLPLLAGERGPGWADLANGTVAGLSMSTRPVEILRAAMEAVAYRFAIIAEMLETASPGEKQVIASGGGLIHSPTWTQIMSDTLGKPVTLTASKKPPAGAPPCSRSRHWEDRRSKPQKPHPARPSTPTPTATRSTAKPSNASDSLYDAVLGGSLGASGQYSGLSGVRSHAHWTRIA